MEFQNYIGGKWVNGNGDKTFDKINPRNEEILACIHAADVSDVDIALQAAQKAFQSWRLNPAPLRGEILFNIGDLLKGKKEELATLLTEDMGKVIAEARGVRGTGYGHREAGQDGPDLFTES